MGREKGDGTRPNPAGPAAPRDRTTTPGPRVRGGSYARAFAWLQAHGDGVDRRLYGDRKRRLLGPLGGTVLEIGAGAGPNAPYLRAGTRWLAVEPNVHFHPRLRQTAEAHDLALTLLPGAAEALPVADASVDAVLSTLVLCSVERPEVALAEVLRVLRPGGRFVFIEHVAAPRGSGRRRLQRLLRRPWGWIADGCRPDRDTERAIRAAGFEAVEVERFGATLGLIRPHIAGAATKAAPAG